MLVSVWVHWVFLTAFLRLCQSHFRWISGSIKCIVSCLFSCLWYSGTRYQEANEVGEVSSMYGLEVVSLLFKRCSDGTIKMHLHHAVNPFDWEINWVTGRLSYEYWWWKWVSSKVLLGLSSMIGWGTQQSKGGLEQSNCSFTFNDAHSLALARAVSGTSQSMETMEQTQDLLERL